MRAFGCLGSSRKNRELPNWGGVGRCVEKGSRRSKRMRHNMGLCRMDRAREGWGVVYFFFLGEGLW